MKRKLNCILLIDDDEPTNFINTMFINRMNCTEKVVAVESGQDGLDYLLSEINGKHPQPDLIFLDINMPGMNGWEFLDAYKKLKPEQQGRITIVMLTTSLNPDDEEKAKQYEDINDFKNKPLSSEVLQDILKIHFSDWF